MDWLPGFDFPGFVDEAKNLELQRQGVSVFVDVGVDAGTVGIEDVDEFGGCRG